MVKIKIFDSGTILEVEDATLCWDTGRRIMRIFDANVGDLIMMTHAGQEKYFVAEVLM